MTTYTAREVLKFGIGGIPSGIPGLGIEIQVLDDEHGHIVATFRDMVLWNVFLAHAGLHKHTVTYWRESGEHRVIRGTEAEPTRETA